MLRSRAHRQGAFGEHRAGVSLLLPTRKLAESWPEVVNGIDKGVLEKFVRSCRLHATHVEEIVLPKICQSCVVVRSRQFPVKKSGPWSAVRQLRSEQVQGGRFEPIRLKHQVRGLAAGVTIARMVHITCDMIRHCGHTARCPKCLSVARGDFNMLMLCQSHVLGRNAVHRRSTDPA